MRVSPFAGLQLSTRKQNKNKCFQLASVTSSLFLLQVVFPIVLLVVVGRREALYRVDPQVDHALDLGLDLLLVGDGVGQIVVN